MRKIGAGSVLQSQALADRVGLNPTDIECLDLLSLNGQMTAGQLAKLTGLTTGAITGLVDRLEKVGYVRRAADPNDRRRVIVEPLEERLRALGPLYEPVLRAMDDVYSRYSDAELAVVLDFARRVNQARDEHITGLRDDAAPKAQAPTHDFVVPLGAVRNGRLEFPKGAVEITIEAGSELQDLALVHFERTEPDVSVQGGTVTIRQRHAFLGGPDKGRITLNPSVPWQIEVRNSAHKLTADLRGVRLEGLDMKGGVHD